MKLLVDRAWKKETYTISRLFVDGKRFYEIIEDRDRGLKKSDTISYIMSKKIHSETAIPSGEYKVRMDVVSPKYQAVKWYNDLCKGRMPRLEGVPGFDGILIHPGNTALDSSGCLLPGRNTKVGQVTQSRETFAALYKQMKAAFDRGEEITIEIL